MTSINCAFSSEKDLWKEFRGLSFFVLLIFNLFKICNWHELCYISYMTLSTLQNLHSKSIKLQENNFQTSFARFVTFYFPLNYFWWNLTFCNNYHLDKLDRYSIFTIGKSGVTNSICVHFKKVIWVLDFIS